MPSRVPCNLTPIFDPTIAYFPVDSSEEKERSHELPNLWISLSEPTPDHRNDPHPSAQPADRGPPRYPRPTWQPPRLGGEWRLSGGPTGPGSGRVTTVTMAGLAARTI